MIYTKPTTLVTVVKTIALSNCIVSAMVYLFVFVKNYKNIYFIVKTSSNLSVSNKQNHCSLDSKVESP